MPKLLIAVLILALGTSSMLARADEERAQAAIETRQGLLKVVASYFGPIVGMARQQIPYDAAVVKTNAEKIAILLPMLEDVFKQDTSSYDLGSGALDDIWENKEDFNQLIATSAERAAQLAAAADQDQGTTMKAFGALGASCKGCHDQYRQAD